MRRFAAYGLTLWVLLASVTVSAALPAEVTQARAELARLDSEVARLTKTRDQQAKENQKLAGEIDQLQRQPAGVRRDLRLRTLLGEMQGKSDQVERVVTELRWRASALEGARKKLIVACDRAARATTSEADRLEVTRLRAAQVAALTSAPQPLGRAPTANVDPLDGPRELADKVDLLRDSGDKLRREADRLRGAIARVERRRHLRERAGSVDDDLFGESQWNRRAPSQQVANANTGGRSGTPAVASEDSKGPAASPQNSPSLGAAPPAAASPGGGTGGQSPVTSDASTGGRGTLATPQTALDANASLSALRNFIDPSTLAELRRLEASDDPDAEMRALRRAESELDSLASELDRRAAALEARAQELKRKK